ncbi:MAG: hypothetical protein O6952_09930 [Planctomycetota bacterium]|nr:hypothetical protein [Planctomycetota bacterium]
MIRNSGSNRRAAAFMILLAVAWTAVMVLNRLGIPDSWSGGLTRYYLLALFLGNLFVVAICAHISLDLISRRVSGESTRSGWFAKAPPLYLALYTGLHLAWTPKFFIGVSFYLALIGVGG